MLAPGLIDMRVQLREPGEEHKETIETGSLAAAAGGVTTMVCLPNTDPVIDDVAGVEFIARRARETRRAKIYCYGAADPGPRRQGPGGDGRCWRTAARSASPTALNAVARRAGDAPRPHLRAQLRRC